MAAGTRLTRNLLQHVLPWLGDGLAKYLDILRRLVWCFDKKDRVPGKHCAVEDGNAHQLGSFYWQ